MQLLIFGVLVFFSTPCWLGKWVVFLLCNTTLFVIVVCTRSCALVRVYSMCAVDVVAKMESIREVRKHSWSENTWSNVIFWKNDTRRVYWSGWTEQNNYCKSLLINTVLTFEVGDVSGLTFGLVSLCTFGSGLAIFGSEPSCFVSSAANMVTCAVRYLLYELLNTERLYDFWVFGYYLLGGTIFGQLLTHGHLRYRDCPMALWNWLVRC